MGIPAHGFFALRKNARTLAVIFALVALGGALIWFWPNALLGEKIVQNSDSAGGKGQTALVWRPGNTARDGDNDGLPDWEELIWRTDPANSDSDRDGTPDGEEVSLNRSPTKPWPDDRMSETAKVNQAAAADGTGSENLTFTLTKTLLESGVLSAIGEDGRITSTDFLDNLPLAKAIDTDTLLQSTPTVSQAALRLNPKNDAETVRQYFTAVAAVYARHLPQRGQKSDLAILTSALQSGDYAKLRELDPLIHGISRTIAEIQSLSTPSSYADTAVRELNYLLRTKRMVEIFRNTPTDPLATVLILSRRLELIAEMAQFHLEVSRDLHQKGIVSGS